MGYKLRGFKDVGEYFAYQTLYKGGIPDLKSGEIHVIGTKNDNWLMVHFILLTDYFTNIMEKVYVSTCATKEDAEKFLYWDRNFIRLSQIIPSENIYNFLDNCIENDNLADVTGLKTMKHLQWD